MAITGTLRLAASKSSREIAHAGPARRDIATKWMMALVLQPMAMATAIAFSKLLRVKTREGVRSSHTISTTRRPQAADIRVWLASAAGMLDAPGNVSPKASAILIMVAAVPMVMQVPWVRAIPASTSSHCTSVIFPARRSSQYFQASDPEPSTLPFQLPRNMGPAGKYTKGTAADKAPITRPGVVLSQPPMRTAPSIGWLRISSSVSIANKLR